MMFRIPIAFFLSAILFAQFENAQVYGKMKQQKTQTRVARLKSDFDITDLQNKLWRKAKEISIEKYWSGDAAPKGRHAEARLLWSETALYVRFEAAQNEPLNVSGRPNLESKTRGLWDRDVCEVFIAPDKNNFRRYFEFEIAPTGEWIDLSVHQLPDRRETDWDYSSGMKSAAEISPKKIVMAMKIEWKAFGAKPKAGDIWMGNLFRCVGSGETRGYLSWQPTKTAKPNFHVPEVFGEFHFSK